MLSKFWDFPPSYYLVVWSRTKYMYLKKEEEEVAAFFFYLNLLILKLLIIN